MYFNFNNTGISNRSKTGNNRGIKAVNATHSSHILYICR